MQRRRFIAYDGKTIERTTNLLKVIGIIVKKVLSGIGLILIAIIVWVGVDAYRYFDIEKIPARAPDIIPDKADNNTVLKEMMHGKNFNSSKILHALENGKPYDSSIFNGVYNFVSNRWDTSDFRLQSLARILYEHLDAISEPEYRLVKNSFLEFKYWMDQPGVDSMCYWSENHQLLFSASEYLAGQYWPAEVFSNSGLTGREHMAMARGRILTWLEQRWLYGFTEWYSNTYYVEDIAPLANLIDFSRDEEIVLKAKIILDLLLYDVASQSYKGTFIATSGRMYENGKRYGEKNSLQATIDSIWDPARWGEEPGERIGMDLNFVYINKYQVPEVIKAIGIDDSRTVIIKASTGLNLTELSERDLVGLQDRQIMMQWAMESFSNPEVIENSINYIQENNMFGNEFLNDFKHFNLGILKSTGVLPFFSRRLKPVTNGVAIQRANTYTYKTPDYMLTTAQAYHPGTFGDQQHIWNATLSRRVSLFTTHPAKPLSDGGALGLSPNYWVGSGRFPHVVQDTNVVLNIYNLPTEPGFMESSVQDYTHAHFPTDRFDEVIIDRNYAFGRIGETYAAFITKNPLHYKEGTNDDLIQPGRNTFWIFEAGSKAEDNSFKAFMQRIRANKVEFSVNLLSYTSNNKSLALSYLGDFKVNGVVQYLNYPRYDSPYIKAEREPGNMTFEYAGKTLNLDFYNMKRTYN